MAAITPVTETVDGYAGLERTYGTSATDSADTLTTTAVAAEQTKRLHYVTVVYDGAPTYTGSALTIGIDSGLGAIYDCPLVAGISNERYTLYEPNRELWLLPGDAIVVSVPAGGANREASIVIVMGAK